MSALLNTLLGLRRRGYLDISAETLVKAHREEGYVIDVVTVTDHLPEVVSEEFYCQEPKATVHLASEYYFAEGGRHRIKFNIHPNDWVQSVQEAEHPDYKIARLCLPIGQRNHGVRFAKGVDYLSYVYAVHNVKSTAGKTERQLRRNIQALENGHWPKPAALYVVGGLISAVPKGINSVKQLPPRSREPLVNVQDGVKTLLKQLERNFTKPGRKGTWDL